MAKRDPILKYFDEGFVELRKRLPNRVPGLATRTLRLLRRKRDPKATGERAASD